MNVLKYIKESGKYILRSNVFISKYIKEVEDLYKMSPDELRDRNEKRFLEMFRLAYTKSSFYSKLYKENGISIDDIRSLDDIGKLPIVTKDMIREHPEELLTCAKWMLIKNHTSGTTGTPLTVYESWPALWRNQADMYCYRKYCGFRTGTDRIASMRGHLDRKDTTVYVNFSKTLYLSSFNLNKKTVGGYYKRLNVFKPKAIEGYPSTLFSLCLLLNEASYKVDIPLIFTSSETLSDNQRRYIEETFHGVIYDHYGNTERTISVSEKIDHSGYFERPGCSINEYYENEVITTSLINKAFPLIRYQVDDKICINNETKSEALSAIVKRIDGRNTENIIGKDGTRYNAAALTYLAKAIPNILIVQLVQNKQGELDINIIPNGVFSTADENATRKAIDEKIGLDNIEYRIRIITHNELIYSKNRKLSLIVSRI